MNIGPHYNAMPSTPSPFTTIQPTENSYEIKTRSSEEKKTQTEKDIAKGYIITRQQAPK